MTLPPSLERGAQIIQEVVATLPSKPGVYRMISASDQVLYVGKAKNLKNRVVSYTKTDALPNRLKRMVSETARMEILVTHTEAEALLLEANLIKRLQPRYNILLKDGKDLSFIVFTHHPAPLLTKIRGRKAQEKGDWYGPFASTFAVDETLVSLHRVFQLRSCQDTVYTNRTRPCLQYHIKRCSAPCVGYISPEDYQQSVISAKAYLKGKGQVVHNYLHGEMMKASKDQNYERAADFRNRLQALSTIQAKQTINTTELQDADVIASATLGGKTAIQVFFFRNGYNYGSHVFFPQYSGTETQEDVMTAFLSQFYESFSPPPLILLNHSLENQELLKQAFLDQHKQKVVFQVPQKGAKFDLLTHAEHNAKEALARALSQKASQQNLLKGVAESFNLSKIPERIEIYDNSHISGKNPYGVMVVYGPDGFMKQSYRKFSIKGDIAPGDDFAMMREVMSRRFKGSTSQESLPDLVLIDGGKGQLSAVMEIVGPMNLTDVSFVAIAKGPDRNAGREDFYLPGQAPFKMDPKSPTLYFLQRLRDEAHRYAITTHRKGRTKEITSSPLDSIPGIGPSRKKALLMHFGSSKGVQQAGVQDLTNVPGISKALAQEIYDYFHP